jgi:hypothetical protein
MTKYEEVCNLLWTEKDWPRGTTPAPVATGVALETQTPAAVAETLDEYVWKILDQSERPTDFKTDAAWKRQLVHQAFGEGGKEFWEYGTALALGQISEPPLDKIAEAKSVSEWLRNHSLRRDRLGFVLLDHTPEGDVEMARREAKAADVPIEWVSAGKALHWRLAVMEGMIPVTLDGFSAVYAAKNPTFRDIRNLSAQDWLDNLRAARRQGSVREKWRPDGTMAPDWNPEWD